MQESASAIEQVVHGYARGHQLLAGSVDLSQEDSDLISRLSDLSGVLPPNGELGPYLTFYPLPSECYFAVAKTWLDDGAPRAGCVLTHTLLIPTEQWALENEPRVFANAFCRPDRNTLGKFGSHIVLRPHESQLASPIIRTPHATDFVTRFFDEGVTPVVWIGQSRADDLAWAIIGALWPRLRCRFAMCTNALQPRSLRDRPFDLMFVLRTAYSRFADLDPIHFIGKPADSGRRMTKDDPDSWCERYAQSIVSRDPDAPSPSRHALWSELPAEPAAIRKLFFLQKLEETSKVTPSTAIGALDLTASIAPAPSTAVAFKQALMTSAIQSTSIGELDAESVQCQMLLNDRLRQPPFDHVDGAVKEVLRRAVATSTTANPSLVLEMARAHLREDPRFAESAFGSGLLDGLELIGESSPEGLAVLADYQESCPSMITARPALAARCLESINAEVLSGLTYSDLADWITQSRSSDSLPELRRRMIPKVTDGAAAEVLQALVQDMPPSEVPAVLDLLIAGTRGFADVGIVEPVAMAIGRPYFAEFQRWAAQLPKWSSGVAEVAALSYPATIGGVRQLLEDDIVPNDSRSQVIATFLNRRCRGRLPTWLRGELESRADLLTTLLAVDPPAPKDIAAEVTRLLDQVQSIPFAENREFVSRVPRWADAAFFKKLVDATAQSVISKTIVDENAAHLWDLVSSEGWLRDWFARVPSWQLRPALVQSAQRGRSELERAFRLLAVAPSGLYRRKDGSVTDALGGLTNTSHTCWSQRMAEQWAIILCRLSEHGHQRELIAACARGLSIAFNNVRLPLGPVVVEAFYPVYDAARSNRPIADAGSLFGFFVWDKPKELRHGLVESYMQSNWAPGGLALACRTPEVLRRVLRDVQRRAAGSRYVRKVAKDLGTNEKLPGRPPDQQLADVMSEYM